MGERHGVAVVQQTSGDAASVMFDAVNAAKARGVDVVLADTAGRLPTQAHLMEELRKIKRVIGRAQEERRTRSCSSSTPTPAKTRSRR